MTKITGFCVLQEVQILFKIVKNTETIHLMILYQLYEKMDKKYIEPFNKHRLIHTFLQFFKVKSYFYEFPLAVVTNAINAKMVLMV